MVVKSPYPDVLIFDLPFTPVALQRIPILANKPADDSNGRIFTRVQFVTGNRKIAVTVAERSFKKGNIFTINSPNLPEYASSCFN